MMGIVMFAETCLAYKKYNKIRSDIKLVFLFFNFMGLYILWWPLWALILERNHLFLCPSIALKFFYINFSDS